MEPVVSTLDPRMFVGLKDVTLRGLMFGSKDVPMVKSNDGSLVSKNKVDKIVFDSYLHILMIMAQLSRLIYCDLSTTYRVVTNPVFGGNDNNLVNDLITNYDKEISVLRRTPDSLGQNGRPMKSYTTPLASNTSLKKILKYISSPSDLTCLIMSGAQLKQKNNFFNDNDVIISFKGSSTVKNFKHDLYSQFTPTEMSTLMPPETKASSGQIGNITGAFVKPLLKSWNLIKSSILENNPARLFVTGHSLGGAYATLFSFIVAECRQQHFPNIKSLHLITFGSPTLLSDKARNTFNNHLDSGFMTLDRVTSTGNISKIPDIVPSIPAGFSHPGFQPLRTEFYPEKKTGRAYVLNKIRSVFQKGGLFGIGTEKTKYERDTLTHMPTKIETEATGAVGNSFAHASYLSMTYLGAFRLPGMKNPGFKGNTFVGDVYESGISWKYVPADPSDTPTPDPIDGDEKLTPPTSSTNTSGGNRKTRTLRKNKNKNKQKYSLNISRKNK